MRVKNVVVAENTLYGTVNNWSIQYLLQLGNPGQHVVPHVEFPGVVPLDLIVDLLVHGWIDAAIEHENAIADKSPNLLVVQFNTSAFHLGIS